MKLPKGVELLSTKFIQEADTCDPRQDADQILSLTIEDSGAGKYFVIKTKRWAFDSIEELIETLQGGMSVGEKGKA